METYCKAFDSRQEFRMEYRLKRYDGKHCWILDTGVPRFWSDGTFAGYIGSCIDISEQKEAAEALRQSHDDLRNLAAKLIRAQEEERRRIAREMHDDWTQRLAVLAIETTKLERQLKLSPPGRSQLQGIREELVKLSDAVHDLSRQLHPSILDDLGLVEALRSECASFSRREGIAVDYQPGEIPTSLGNEMAMCIYRVAQEALRNIGRHAAVKHASVSLAVLDSELVLRVQDQGIGFDPASNRGQPGLGLESMHERARLAGADLSVQSTPGKGTTIAVRAPLR
jgi:signal transduction histidine kinase